MFFNKNKKFISLKKAAVILGYAPDHIGWLIRQGRLTGRRASSKKVWRVSREAIIDYARNKNQEISSSEKEIISVNGQAYISLKEAAKLSGYAPDYIGWLVRKGKIEGKEVYLKASWELSEEEVIKYKEVYSGHRRRKFNFKFLKSLFSKKNFDRFFWRYSLAAFVFLFVIFGLGPIEFLQNSIQAFSERTRTVRFYVTEAQGNWQNPQNVLGSPNIGEDGIIDNFSGANSAVYSHGALNLVLKNFQIEKEAVAELSKEDPKNLSVPDPINSEEDSLDSIPTSSEENLFVPDTAEQEEEPSLFNIVSVDTEEDDGLLEIPDIIETDTEDLSETTSLPNQETSFFSPLKNAVSDGVQKLKQVFIFDNLAIAKEEASFESAKIKISFAIDEKKPDLYLMRDQSLAEAGAVSKVKSFFSNAALKVKRIIRQAERIDDMTLQMARTGFKVKKIIAEQAEKVRGLFSYLIVSAKTTDFFANSILETDTGSVDIMNPIIASDDNFFASSTDTPADSFTPLIMEETAPLESSLTASIGNLEIIENLTAVSSENQETTESLATTSFGSVQTTESLLSLEEEIFEPELPEENLPSIDTKIKISYSLDGEIWYLLDEITDYPLSNKLNDGYFEYDASFLKNWEDVENLQIKFEGVVGGETNVVAYLDSVWVEAVQEDAPAKTEKVETISLRKEFQLNESPEFKFKYNKINKSLLASLSEALNITDYWKDINIQAEIKGPEGKVFTVSPEFIFNNNGEFSVKLPREFFADQGGQPGVYELILKITENGETQEIDQEFKWGVLAINVNKSIYLPNEQAYLQMGVLADDGDTVCDADLALKITDLETGAETNLSTADGTIQYSGKCGRNNVTDMPDYFAYYQAGGAGIYQMELTNLDTNYEITDSFEVRDSVPFDIERIGPTRIYPPATYEMVLKIKPSYDFNGEITEPVPAGFELTTLNAT
ncbi:MAG: helix-turn-helix domain-containing protein, partial [bacterium]